MSSLFDAVRSWFDDASISYRADPRAGVIEMDFEGRNGSWRGMAVAREAAGILTVYSVAPLRVEPPHRDAVVRFATLVNHGLPLGAFEVGLESGEVRFRTAVGTDDEPVPPAVLRNVIFGNMAVMDQYFKGLLAVSVGSVAPDPAVAQCEGRLAGPLCPEGADPAAPPPPPGPPPGPATGGPPEE